MNTAHASGLLAELAAMRDAYIERVRRWPGVAGHEEDVVQDAFARAVASAHALRDKTHRDQWFFRVLQSAYVDHRRRTDARTRMLLEIADAVRSTGEVTLETAIPEARALSCACLHEGLAALRPDYRKALEVVELDGRSLAELGAIAGITPNNAGVRVHRARVALARLTRDCCQRRRTSDARL